MTDLQTIDARLDSRLPVDIDTSPDDLRAAVRAWITQHVPAEWLSAARRGDVAELRRVRPAAIYKSWYPTFAASGLVVPTWPVEHGGLALTPTLSRIIDEEVGSARLPRLNVLALGLAGPSILRWGTDDQKARHLWPIVTNQHVWCQLFSEPGAGSDLASLATRAVRAGNNWIINGQKVWSSFAHEADFGMLLARTDPDAAKHKGITYFLLDMRAEGVEVRPLRQITGDAEFNEVFFEDVLAEDRARLGPEGQGWSVAMTTLMNERATISGTGSGFAERFGGRSIERIIEFARQPCSPDAALATHDLVVRQRIIQCWIESRLVTWTNQRARAARQAGREVGAEGSIGKLFHSEHNRRLQELALDVLGARATAHLDSDPEAGALIYGFLRSRSETIAGGTSEVQRNILGERVLGLPREPEADRALPWKNLARGL